MKEVITLLIFTIPGLLSYFWINLFGVTPSNKQKNSEVAAISTLLWIPIVSIVFVIYNILALISHWSVVHFNKDIPILKKNWRFIDSLVDLTSMSGNIWFLLFYVLLAIVISFYLSKLISKKLYKKMVDQINQVREGNDIAPLGLHATVWDSIFLNNKGQIIEYKKIGETYSIMGSLTKVPRAHETSKAIVLEAVDHWGSVLEYYNIQIDNTYIDINNGIMINIYNSASALEAQSLFNERFPNGVTSSE